MTEQQINSQRIYRSKNIEKVRAWALAAYYRKRETNKQTSLNWYRRNKSRAAEIRINWVSKNTDHILQYRKLYYAENRDIILAKQRLKKRPPSDESRERDRKRNQSPSRKLWKSQYRKTPHELIRNRIASRIVDALKKFSIPKTTRTEVLLGTNIGNSRQHIESLFKTGMSWENHGKWHIDHIKPCASFNLANESEQRKCFHYTNLQPLWASENISKSNKTDFFDGQPISEMTPT